LSRFRQKTTLRGVELFGFVALFVKSASLEREGAGLNLTQQVRDGIAHHRYASIPKAATRTITLPHCESVSPPVYDGSIRSDSLMKRWIE